MSSYRKLDPSLTITEDLRDAVYVLRTVKRSAPLQTESAKASSQEEAYRHRRKSTPANILLPRTSKWTEQLPPRVKPIALMRQFPRVANLIAAAWDDLIQFEIYMDSLLTDKRGGRKGFPTDVIAELAALDIYRHTLKGRALPGTAWSEVGRRG